LSETQVKSESSLVYRPKQRKRLLYAIITLPIGLFGLLGLYMKSRVPVISMPQTPDLAFKMYFFTAFFLGIGLCLAALLIRGAPRLTIDRDRLVLRTLFRTQSIGWSRLGQFTVITEDKGRRGERLGRASAPIIAGTGTGNSVTLPNAFTVPLATILDELAQYHHGVPGDVPIVIHAPVRPAGVPGFRFAWMTVALLGVFVGVFVLEQRLALTPPAPGLTPSLDTLVAMGALNWDLVQSGQWFRLFTAPFLHAGLGHLLGNAIAFILAGYRLERLIGRAWTFLIFAVGALAGSCMSLLVSAPATVSVGASGGIMAMLAALFVTSFRMPVGPSKRAAQIQSARITIPALLPISRGAAALHVDYGAHFGGVLLGVAVGFFLLRTWRDDAPMPRFGRPALVVALVGVLCFAAGGVGAAWEYGTYESAQADRIPADELPHTTDEILARSAKLVAAYPRDALANFYDGEVKLHQGDPAGAEQRLRTGLAQSLAEPGPDPDRPRLTNTIRGELALALLAEGHRPEAQAISHELCSTTGPNAPTAVILADLSRDQLCPGARLAAAPKVGP
jgi:rhomboid protease GluP